MRDDELLRRYLLGELSEEDGALLEARLIQDDALFERAEAMEADLLEENVHGGLSAAQRARILRHLASSAATRSQLAMVRGLGTVARGDRRVLTGPWGGTELSRPWVRGLAAAAMLAIAVGSAWMAGVTVPLPQEAEQRVAETPAPQAPPDRRPVPPVRPPALPPEAPERVAREEPAPAAPPAVVPYVFELALTTFRGPEDGAEELRIPAGTERVDIRLPLRREDEASSPFLVILRDAAGTELIRRTDLQLVRAGESAALVLPVEAKLLQAGRYSVEVYGAGDEALGFPEFQVPEP